METYRVIESIDVVCDFARRVLKCLVGSFVGSFNFEAAEKTFHRSVVVAVSFSAHALQKTTDL